ncbi:MAG TPA: 2,3-bisphosphoglycerate-independent phosphoglycerate mutase [Candidatus Nitrosocosmicus sp.]|nr:2,3-bisphosphoglycerate-independent phosphoglycerate mutase [Candidatus Nitrosocosmicus sp.]
MQPVILIVLDGYGIAPEGDGNAINIAHPQNLNTFFKIFPSTQLRASGEAVGLPEKEVGNTEVGHINMGAGKIVYQSLPRIDLSIADGSFYKNQVFIDGVDHMQKTGGDLHIIGLVGRGSVHASVGHLYALLYLCKENGVKNVYIHAITDGRDSPPKEAKTYLAELQSKIDALGLGKIASVIGRYYAMDRDKRWDRIEKAYLCLTEADGVKYKTWEECVDSNYNQSKTDEFIEPSLILGPDNKISQIKQGDTVIFYNYRIDRPRELTKAFVLDDFQNQANASAYDPFATKYYKSHLVTPNSPNPTFDRKEKIKDLFFITMTEYQEDLPVHVAFPRHVVPLPLGRILEEKEIPQLRMSESEKERFVTYYFNGLRENPFQFEDRIIIPSPQVATYDLKPEMSAHLIADELVKQIIKQKYKFILVNFANADMVGHTGNVAASIKAVQELDIALGKVVEQALRFEYTTLITADHGNAESMKTADGEISTEHTGNPVPLLVINNRLKGKPIKLQSGILADIAPTILSLLDIIRPQQMTGRNLLEEIKSQV